MLPKWRHCTRSRGAGFFRNSTGMNFQDYLLKLRLAAQQFTGNEPDGG
jgi:hypothetical protein